MWSIWEAHWEAPSLFRALHIYHLIIFSLLLLSLLLLGVLLRSNRTWTLQLRELVQPINQLLLCLYHCLTWHQDTVQLLLQVDLAAWKQLMMKAIQTSVDPNLTRTALLCDERFFMHDVYTIAHAACWKSPTAQETWMGKALFASSLGHKITSRKTWKGSLRLSLVAFLFLSLLKKFPVWKNFPQRCTEQT